MNFATTKEKILQYLDFKGISNTNFFKETQIKRGFLDSDKLKASVSDIFLTKIIATYPEINLEWLITGNGEMLKKEVLYATNEVENVANDPGEKLKSNQSLLQEIENLKKTIKMIEEERDFLRQLIKPPSIEKSASA